VRRPAVGLQVVSHPADKLLSILEGLTTAAIAFIDFFVVKPCAAAIPSLSEEQWMFVYHGTMANRKGDSNQTNTV